VAFINDMALPPSRYGLFSASTDRVRGWDIFKVEVDHIMDGETEKNRHWQ
jgi:hypothetical protein